MRAVRPLSAEERARLPLLARGAALRFLLTRLVDWLNVPPGALVRPKDPLEYFRKLRFHQAVTSVRDYGIEWRAQTMATVLHRRRQDDSGQRSRQRSTAAIATNASENRCQLRTVVCGDGR